MRREFVIPHGAGRRIVKGTRLACGAYHAADRTAQDQDASAIILVIPRAKKRRRYEPVEMLRPDTSGGKGPFDCYSGWEFRNGPGSHGPFSSPARQRLTLVPAVRQAADGSDDGRLRCRNWRQLVV